jgi:PAS domain-containing protein
MNTVFFSMTHEGIFTWISLNNFECLGWSPEESIGQLFWKFIIPENIINDRNNSLIGLTHEYEMRVLHKNGEKLPAHIKVLRTPENIVGCATILGEKKE